MLNQFKSEINAQEILQIQNQINLRQIYISVFKLFGLKWKYDPDLSVTKIYAYYQNNNDLQKQCVELQKQNQELQKLIVEMSLKNNTNSLNLLTVLVKNKNTNKFKYKNN